MKRNEQHERTPDSERNTARDGNANQLITQIGPNDVLMGRGAPFLNFEGNRRFRSFAKTLRVSYREAGRNRLKSEIAKRLFHHIVDSGGRFLQCARDTSAVGGDENVSIQDGTRTWQIAKREVALEKCKQTLRDRDPPSGGHRGLIAAQRAQQLRAVELSVAPPPNPVTSGYHSTFHQGPSHPIPSMLPQYAVSQVQPFNHQPNISSLSHPQGNQAPPPASYGGHSSFPSNSETIQQQLQQQLIAAQQLQQFGHYLAALGMQKVAQIQQQSAVVVVAGVASASTPQDVNNSFTSPQQEKHQGLLQDYQPPVNRSSMPGDPIPNPLQVTQALHALTGGGVPCWVQPNAPADGARVSEAAGRESSSDSSITTDQRHANAAAPGGGTLISQGGATSDSSEIPHWVMRNASDFTTQALTELEALIGRGASSSDTTSSSQSPPAEKKPPAKTD